MPSSVIIGSGGSGSGGSGSNASVGLNGAVAPTSSTEIGFINGSGNEVGVSATNPLPITGTITASNPSVGLIGTTAPTSATEIGVIDISGKLQGASASNPVRIDPTGTTLQPVSGTITANQGTSPWIVAGGGTAGTAATGVVTVQGIAAMTPLLVTSTFSSPQHVIVDSGTITAVTAITNALPAGTNVIGHVIADSGSTTAVTGIVEVSPTTAANTNTNPFFNAITDGIIGPVEVQPGIGTATVPPTFTTAGADNSDPALTVSMSPNSGLPAIIQKTSGTGSGSQTSLATSNFASAVTAGNSIVVVVGVGNSGAVGVTDTLGNSYTQAVVQANSTTFQVVIFYATNIKGGTNAVTVTPSASVSLDIAAYEVSGIIGVGAGGSTTTTPSTANQQNSVDAATSASGTSTTPATNPLKGWIQFPNEIAFGGIAIGTADQTPTAFTPWNKDFDLPVGGTPSGLFGLHTFSQPLGSGNTTVSLSATITSEPWAVAIVSFKSATLTVGGIVTASGFVAAGSQAIGNPVVIAGVDPNGTVRSLGLQNAGTINTVASTPAGDATSNSVSGLLYSSNGNANSLNVFPYVFNGSTWDRPRSATVGNAVAATGLPVSASYGEYLSAAPAPTTGQYSALQTDYAGSLFVKPIRRSTTVSQATTITTSTAATTILAAQAAGIFADISSLIVTVTPAATAVADVAFTITLSDGTKSYIFDMETGATGSTTVSGNPPTQVCIEFNPPIPASTAATAWTQTNSVSTGVVTHTTVVAVLQKAS